MKFLLLEFSYVHFGKTSPYRRKDLLLLLSSPLPEHQLFLLVLSDDITRAVWGSLIFSCFISILNPFHRFSAKARWHFICTAAHADLAVHSLLILDWLPPASSTVCVCVCVCGFAWVQHGLFASNRKFLSNTNSVVFVMHQCFESIAQLQCVNGRTSTHSNVRGKVGNMT